MHWNFSDILRRPQEGRLARSDGTILVEIGFGNGEYLLHTARSRPDALIVGIETSQWCITKAARRALAFGIGNIRVLHGDAKGLLPYAFEPGVISEAFMNFPCPWPKKKHAERRVASPRFPGLICGGLCVGGSFTLATDVEWYALETQEAFASDNRFETGLATRNPERGYLTKYERKWREMGRDTFTVTARKVRDEQIMRTESEDAMSEVRAAPAKNAWELRERLSSVTGETLRGSDYIVIFRELFFADDGTALISVISVDEGFEQHYYIKAIPGDITRGKIDPVGHPYRTPGVRASMRRISQIAGVSF
ncbi:MAG: tRNA (guanosine(46)-N7)-methyltransferase TrmB [Synergistaceae bacterium]|jgi:tRNA (guanine-N7-)-methyltransferase|nr:tRNA (guanosine(46)-N7)-methyltransferase TrmB [Synergistaceae bacterium]